MSDTGEGALLGLPECETDLDVCYNAQKPKFNKFNDLLFFVPSRI